VIRSFEYSGLIQSREVGVLLYILLANIQNASEAANINRSNGCGCNILIEPEPMRGKGGFIRPDSEW
jgi:hypothetical protein